VFGESCVYSVYFRFEKCDVVSGDTFGLEFAFWLGSELAAKVEKFVLYPLQGIVVFGRKNRSCDYEAYPRVEFVDAPVGLEAGVVFSDALSAYERCCSGIAGFGINFHCFKQGQV
jgi:hypothetical protein